MSDESADTHSDNAEPSMEDILASIRRIIADDDAGGLNDAAIAGVSAAAVTPSPESVDLSDVTTASEDFDDLEDLISGDAAAVSDIDDILTLETIDSDVSDSGELETLDIADEQVSNTSSNSPIGLAALGAASLSATAAAGAAAAQKLTQSRKSPALSSMLGGSSEDPLELLLDEEMPSNLVSNDTDLDLLESLLETPDVSQDLSSDAGELLESVMPEKQGDEDLDLVKSLMADLTSSPLYDEDEPEVPSEDASAESDLVDEILSLTMDDELEVQAEQDTPELSRDEDAADLDVETNDVLEAMLNNSQDHISSEAQNDSSPDEEIDELLSAIDTPDTTPSDGNSLLQEIAKAAKDDAERSERLSAQTSAGFTAGAGLMIASAGPLAATISGRKIASANTEVSDAGDVDDTVDILQSLEDVINADAVSPETEQAPLNDDDMIDDVIAEAVVPDQSLSIDEPELDIQSKADADTADTDTNLTQETADMPKAAAKKDAIIDEATEKVTASAFASLNSAVEEKATNADRGDRIGDLVQEALRPMLKEWLDKNLKTIVERAVTKEVKRISSGK